MEINIKSNSKEVIADLTNVQNAVTQTRDSTIDANRQTEASYLQVSASIQAMSNMHSVFAGVLTGSIALMTAAKVQTDSLTASLQSATAEWNNLTAAIQANSLGLALNIQQSVMSTMNTLMNAIAVNLTKAQYDALNESLAKTNENLTNMNVLLIVNSVLLLINSVAAYIADTVYDAFNKALEKTKELFEGLNKLLFANTLLLALNAVVLLLSKLAIDKENKSLTANTTRRTNNNKRMAAAIGLRGFELGAMAGFPVGLALGPVMGAMFTAAAFAIAKMGVAAMAAGGIVSAPTVALVGEGRYPEAVVPLGDSPQFANMKTDIANAVIRAMTAMGGAGGRSGSDLGGEIVLNVDGVKLARAVLPNLENEQKRRGYTLAVREG